MRIILITAHLTRLIAHSKFRNGLPVYNNGLIFYYFNDNFVQCTFELFDLSYWENRLPASEADFCYSVSNADSLSSSWVWPTKRSFTASIIRVTNTTVVASFRFTF